MIERLQMLSPGQRLFVFFFIFGGGLFLLIAVGLFLYMLTLNAQPREIAQAVARNITVSEFATWDDDDAYPGTLTAAPDGTLYTGSYRTGTIYTVRADGTVEEVSQTRELIASVAAIAVADDSTLYVLDRLSNNPRSAGGAILRFKPGDEPMVWGEINDTNGFISPQDLAIDGDYVYATDIGRREIWRFDADGNGELFWHATPDMERGGDILPTGLAYDAQNNDLIMTDSGTNALYRIDIRTGATELIYRRPAGDEDTLFDGVDVAPDGTLYVAGLGGGVFAIRAADDVTLLADNFRGASDVAFVDGRLFVTNFDSASLAQAFVRPQLPFALDVIDFIPPTEATEEAS